MPVVIIGASTRAAAFSALRAGLQPWCADLFADLDLQVHCPVQRLKGNYPEDFAKVIQSDLPGAWMYTGGLENRPALLESWCRHRPLWGIRGEALRWVRDPIRVSDLLHEEGLPALKTSLCPPKKSLKRWLVKARHSCGGLGVRRWSHDEDGRGLSADVYWQEYRAGQPAAALYAAVEGVVHFLGLTRQLVGVPWLHAKPFQYCGSIGPLQPPPALRDELHRLGEVLGRRCHLTGLFGVDGILARSRFWPVEINPRYTASVEVLEYATGLQALAWQRRAFDPDAPNPIETPHPTSFVGKAILFAPEKLSFPAEGPWLSQLRTPTALHIAPDFADISAVGEAIPRGRPILTFFVQEAKLPCCEDALRAIAEELTDRLFPMF